MRRNWLHRKAQRVDPLRYPSGGSRLENIGNICYAFLMGSVSLILIVESIRALATGGDGAGNFHMCVATSQLVPFGGNMD